MTDDLRTDRIDEAVLALLSQHLRAFALWRSECVEVLEPGCDGQASRKRFHLRSGDQAKSVGLSDEGLARAEAACNRLFRDGV